MCEMTCPKCKGNKKIVVMTTFNHKNVLLNDDYGSIGYRAEEVYGLIQDCDYCHGEGEVPDPDW